MTDQEPEAEPTPELTPEERAELLAPVVAQQRHYRNVLAWVALAVALVALWFGLSSSIALARRTPTLDYMACHDKRQDKAITHELRTFNDLIADPTADPAERIRVGNKLIDRLEDATNTKSKDGCPALPIAK